jgi:hypothetical protein
MTEVTLETELAVRLRPEGLEMAHLIATVGAARVETLASCSYHEHDRAVMLLITSDPLKTTEWLRAANFPVKATDVVLVRAAYEPALAMRLGQRLRAAGIEVLCSYVSCTEGHRAYAVFKTTDNNRAVSVLRAETVAHDGVPARAPAEYVVA